MFYQSIFILLGGLLSVSEILPFIDQTSANGIIEFIVQLFIQKTENDTESKVIDSDNRSLLNYDDDILKITDYICNLSNENTEKLMLYINEELKKHFINHNNSNHVSIGEIIKFINDQKTHINEMHNIMDDLVLSIKNMDQNLLKNKEHIQDLVVSSDSVQNLMLKSVSNNDNNIIQICEMILQHLQELQRKYNVQNNTLMEMLNKNNDGSTKDESYNKKLLNLLENISNSQEEINIQTRNNMEILENLLKNQDILVSNINSDIHNDTDLLKSFMKNQEEINRYVKEIYNGVNNGISKKKKTNLFFNNKND